MNETFTPFPDVNSIDILRIILRGSPGMNYNRIGKFLPLVLVKAQHLSVLKRKDIKDLQVEINCGCVHIFPVWAIWIHMVLT